MAKKKRKKRSTNHKVQRDTTPSITRHQEQSRLKREIKRQNDLRKKRQKDRIKRSDLIQKELSRQLIKAITPATLKPDDRRTHRRRAIRSDGRHVSYTLRDPKNRPYLSSGTLARVGFEDPKMVNVCRRRKERRETLFAMKRIGKGKSGPKKRRYNEYSKVRC